MVAQTHPYMCGPGDSRSYLAKWMHLRQPPHAYCRLSLMEQVRWKKFIKVHSVSNIHVQAPRTEPLHPANHCKARKYERQLQCRQKEELQLEPCTMCQAVCIRGPCRAYATLFIPTTHQTDYFAFCAGVSGWSMIWFC